jgi:hypothetical protein
MAYAQLSVVQTAMSYLGVDPPVSMSDGTPQQVKASAQWDHALRLVLEEEDWRFAKTRTGLGLGADADADEYGYLYAFQLPTDFVKLCDWDPDDTPIYPPGVKFVLEEVPIGTPVPTWYKCLLWDYDNANEDAYIVYIRLETNAAAWPGYFADCVAWKLANLTCKDLIEDPQAFAFTSGGYDKALLKAKGKNKGTDHTKGESGNTDWLDAGRSGLAEVTAADWSVGR